mgnify:CR=1 FL=1
MRVEMSELRYLGPGSCHELKCRLIKSSIKKSIAGVVECKVVGETRTLVEGTDVTIIQKLPGHNDLKTTLPYLHISNRDLLKIVSLLDELDL